MNLLDAAFESVPRAGFLPSSQASFSRLDIPLPIGFGQTNSQPSTVKMMLEWLDVEPGHKILDVGSGSGWTTALLSRLTGPEGRVYGVEAIPELVEFGARSNARAGITNAEFFLAGRHYGLPKFAPYDRILVSASADAVPKDLLEQLSGGGKIVIPIKDDVLEIEKTAPSSYEILTHSGFRFVPLVTPTGGIVRR
jgi:protein-L-isoaspartate(D-aspartate) O-methyltransferase